MCVVQKLWSAFDFPWSLAFLIDFTLFYHWNNFFLEVKNSATFVSGNGAINPSWGDKLLWPSLCHLELNYLPPNMLCAIMKGPRKYLRFWYYRYQSWHLPSARDQFHCVKISDLGTIGEILRGSPEEAENKLRNYFCLLCRFNLNWKQHMY